MGHARDLAHVAVVLSLLAVTHGEQHGWCESVPAAPFEKGLTQLYACSTVPPFMLAYMWSPVQVKIHCPTSWFSVYRGDSQDLLRKNIKERATAFCGWERYLDGRDCRFQMSPFWQTFVGISDGSSACHLDAKLEFSLPMMLATIVGVALFYAAPHLTSSLFFRLSCGSLMFTAGSLLILIFIIMRRIPYKRTAGVALGLMGTSGMAVLRWATGHWLPSWTQLSQNPLFQGYVLASIIVGAALTYWFDDRANPKLNTLILAALRTAALALVYYGTWMMPVAFAGMSGVLLTSLVSPQMQANMEHTRARVQRATTATAALIMSPFTRTPPPEGSTPLGASAGRSGGAGTSPGFPGFSFWGSAGSLDGRRQARLRELEQERERRLALGLPAGTEPDLCDLTPLHLKTPPPDPWSLAFTKSHDGTAGHVASFEEKYSQALVRQQLQGSPGGVRRRGASGATSSGPDGVAASGGRASGQASQGTWVGGVQYVSNPQTGRMIKVGGDTYMRLVEKGWAVERRQGVMVPPQEAEEGPGRGAARAAAARDSSRSSGQGKTRSQRT